MMSGLVRSDGKRKIALLTMGGALLLSVVLGGCTSIHDHRGYIIDKTLVQSVLPGIDNKASVERTLGRPTFVAQFGEPAWYYVSADTNQPPFRGPHPVKETVLRVRFDARGTVAAIDQTGIDRVATIHPDHDLTPTLGKKRGFFQDLFGNIGTVGAGGVGGGEGGEGGGGGGGGTGPNGS